MPFFYKKQNKPLKKTKLRVVGISTTAELKREIQDLLRQIVIIRDGGCILRYLQGKLYKDIPIPYCNGYKNDGTLIYQADHLLERSNSETYAVSKLVVCVCKGHHGWKSVGSNLRKKEYDSIIRDLLPPERVKLWDACEKRRLMSYKMGAYDWKLEIINLRAELAELKKTYDKNNNVIF